MGALARNFKISLLASLSLMLGHAAYALQSDREQPTTIDANQMTYSEKSNVNVFSGNVLLTRGSLVIRGDKLTLTQMPDGTQFAAVEGKPATFAQQRDSETNDVLLIKGRANRIEFDGAKEIVKLNGSASIQKTNNDQITEEITGKTITYEQASEFLTVDSSGKTPDGKPSRVQAVIKPVTKPGSAQ